MNTVFALLCFVVFIHWLIFPYPSGLLHWHCGNLTIAPVPAKQPWWIWINTWCEFIMNDRITTTKQSTTKPWAYFLGYTVCMKITPALYPKLCPSLNKKEPRPPSMKYDSTKYLVWKYYCSGELTCTMYKIRIKQEISRYLLLLSKTSCHITHWIHRYSMWAERMFVPYQYQLICNTNKDNLR